MDEHGYQNYPSDEPPAKIKSFKTHKSFDEVILDDTTGVFEPGQIQTGHNSQQMNSAGSEFQTNRDSRAKEDDPFQKINYSIEYVPSWLNTLGLGFQVYLMMAGTTVSLPFVLTKAMCMNDDDPNRTTIISTFIFVSGVITILQSSFGTRLPIVQGGSTAFLIPALAILSLKEVKCKDMTREQRNSAWMERMREIQGAIIISSIFQVAFGFFGVIGLVLRFITPLTVAASISMIGLSLFRIAGEPAGTQWGISIPTILLIIIFSQYMAKIKIPVPFTKSTKRQGPKFYQPFQNLPLLFGMVSMWIFCWILTESGALSKDSAARTDIQNFTANAPFFVVPYPFQWGLPIIQVGAVFGMLAGVIAGIIESIGDYYACARIVGAKPPPLHAVNRGIFIEGIGCIIAGMFGTGNGTTSYSENVGAIGVTQVGSRRVIQVGGLFMICFSLFGKVNALFVSIPEPVIGAFLIVVFAMVTAVGISNLRGVNLNSPRNIFVIGFSIFFSLTLSQWMRADEHKGAIKTGYPGLDQFLSIFLSTGMFLGGLIAFILDNTIPGTREERGLEEWDRQFERDRVEENETGATRDDSYDLPFVMPYLRRSTLAQWIPISPTFKSENYQEVVNRAFERFIRIFTRRHPQPM